MKDRRPLLLSDPFFRPNQVYAANYISLIFEIISLIVRYLRSGYWRLFSWALSALKDWSKIIEVLSYCFNKKMINANLQRFRGKTSEQFIFYQFLMFLQHKAIIMMKSYAIFSASERNRVRKSVSNLQSKNVKRVFFWQYGMFKTSDIRVNKLWSHWYSNSTTPADSINTLFKK